MMNVAIMQPYLFPYIGYFQLMAQTDIFVIHDDVQYIKDGWINRNRIFAPGGWRWLTLPVRKADHALSINQRYYVEDHSVRRKFFRLIEATYHRAPYFDVIAPVVVRLMDSVETNVARFNKECMGAICGLLGMSGEVVLSSAIRKDDSLRGEARVIELCCQLGASRYINPIGGRDLYRDDSFSSAGIDLRFLQARPGTYAQFGAEHQPFLSIIDVLMFRGVEGARTMLGEFDYLAPLPRHA